MKRDEHYLQIGEVADRTGTTHRTLRFYEERGLLKPPSRMDGGFRLYSENEVSRVEQIKRLQSLLGLTLAEIKENLEAEKVQEELSAAPRPDHSLEERIYRTEKRIEVTQQQFEIISAKVDAMVKMRLQLQAKLKHYSDLLEEFEKEKGSS